MIRAKRIIVDSIKDHLIPQLSSKDTPKDMFDSLSGRYEEEPPKKLTNEEVEEYILFSALSRSLTPRSDTWLIDSGASKHMTSLKKNLSSLEERDSPHKVSLGDDYQYPIKGIGEATYKLDSRTPSQGFLNSKNN